MPADGRLAGGRDPSYSTVRESRTTVDRKAGFAPLVFRIIQLATTRNNEENRTAPADTDPGTADNTHTLGDPNFAARSVGNSVCRGLVLHAMPRRTPPADDRMDPDIALLFVDLRASVARLKDALEHSRPTPDCSSTALELTHESSTSASQLPRRSRDGTFKTSFC